MHENVLRRWIRELTADPAQAFPGHGQQKPEQLDATIASLLPMARLKDIDPNAWLTQTLERIAAGWPNKDIDALMPWNFASP